MSPANSGDIYYSILSVDGIGNLGIALGPRGLCRITLAVRDESELVKRLKRQFPNGSLRLDLSHTLEAERQLQDYFRGTRNAFQVPLDWGAVQTRFQKDVLHATGRIPYGQVMSYGALAAWSGHPGAARAVGNALAQNPFPIVIPCHRVVAGDGSLGGFAGGLSLKRKLLELEGVRPPKNR